MKDLSRMPEILNGLPINWAAYEPSGGDRFRKHLNEELIPALNAAREQCQRNRDRFVANVKFISSVTDAFNSIREILPRITESVSTESEERDFSQMIGTDSRYVPLNETAKDWILKAPEALKGIDAWSKSVEMWKMHINIIDEDLKYVSAISGFLSGDQDCDMLLYAIYNVEKKFRIKVFRAAYKKEREIEEFRQVIAHTKSALKASIEPKYKVAFDGLSKYYDALLIQMKIMKKGIDQHGAEFFDMDNATKGLMTVKEQKRLTELVRQLPEGKVLREAGL